MSHFMIQTVLIVCCESIYYRAVARVLTMRSNILYYAVSAFNLSINLLLRARQASAQNSLLGLFLYIAIPVALSVGSLRTRIARSTLLYFVMMLSEVTGSVTYELLAGEIIVFEQIGPDDITMVVTTYVVIILVIAIATEIVVAHYARIDEGVGAVTSFEMPVIGLLLTTLLSFNVSYIRLYRLSGETMRLYGALFAFFFTWVSLLVIFLLYSSAQRETEVRRKMAEHALALRKDRHMHREVEAVALHAEGMSSLRHTLANQVRTIHRLAEAGDTNEASRRLFELQTQAQILSHELAE